MYENLKHSYLNISLDNASITVTGLFYPNCHCHNPKNIFGLHSKIQT